MIMVTIDIIDERTGLDHMHRSFLTEDRAVDWIAYMSEFFGERFLNEIVAVKPSRWECPRCRQVLHPAALLP